MRLRIDQQGGSAPSIELDQSGQRDQTETASPAESGFPAPTGKRHSGISARYSDVVPKGSGAADMADEGLDDIEVIIHELGNKLSVLGNAFSLLKKQLPKDAQEDENLGEILTVIDVEHSDMSHILKRVRTSAQNALSSLLLPEEVPEYVVIDLSEMIEAQVKLWRRVLRTKIAITRDFAPGIKIRGDHLELNELIHNIFKNAVQIMQQLPEEERRLHVRVRQKEGYIQVFVHDNGPGIKDEDQKKLFKKGFTKKNGKGIGLYYSQILARKMGGDIVLMNNKDLLDVEPEDEISPDDPVKPRKIRLADYNGAVAIIEFPVLEEDVK